jgi:ADP-L-glycero-D-manno-heptose 6-epimerase|tara:strand:- start:1192 stop:2001 length:810 start_codon:yes stop_codon:yes gene_type:complete
MKILITGHEGFIGKNLAVFLEKDNDLFGYEWDPEFLPDVSVYDWVIHLGAISATTERDIDKVMLQNYEFSKWLYNECNTHGVNLQYASSASVYGVGTDFNEDAPKQPQSYYATSKYLFDRWVMQQKHDIIVQGFRYFNVYGPSEDHKGDQASPITKFFKQAQETGVITLFEDSDKYLRDFVYVGDCCNIHRYMLTTTETGIFNIGTGVATSFQTVAELIAKKFNAKIEYVPMPKKLIGQYQEYTCANIERLSNVVNINFTSPKDFIDGK